MLSQVFVDTVKACGVKALAERYTELKPVDRWTFLGRCPNPEHEDKNPSFQVWINKKTGLDGWCCFSCHTGKKGSENFGSDNIAFLQWMYYHTYHKRLSFVEAVKRVATFYHIPIEEDKNIRFYQENKENCQQYERQLNPFVKNYLYMRGLGDEDIARWHLGFDGNRITFPISDTYGNIIGFSNRAFSQEAIASGHKYINSSSSKFFQKKNVLYGAQFLDKQIHTIFIVEGQFDAIIGAKYGIPNIVATMTCHLSEEHVAFIKNHNLKPILCFDNDKAGRTGMLHSLAALHEAGIKNIRFAFLPDERDIADLGRDVKDKLKDVLRGRIMSYSQYILKGIADDIDASILAKRQEALPKIREVLSSIEDPDEELIAKDFIEKRMKLWSS